MLKGVTVKTIQHQLEKDLSLPTFKPAEKPLLLKHMVNRKLVFASKYKDWIVEQQRRAHFGDKST